MTNKKNSEHLIYSEIRSGGKIIESAMDKYFENENDILNFFNGHEGICFVGCGSSYHVGIIGKFIYEHLINKPCTCATASEILLYPDHFFNRNDIRYVFLSRTGSSTETVLALEIARKRNKKSMAIVTIKDSKLMSSSDYAIVLDSAKEKSITATRSVIGTTTLLSGIIFLLSNKKYLLDKILSGNKLFYNNFKKFDDYIHSLIFRKDYSNFIFLGSGPFYGVAKEAELKVTEMSISYVASCHTLEFRHGHKSIIDNKSLIIIFLSKEGFEYEIKTAMELVKLTGEVLLIGDRIDKNKTNGLFKNVIDIGLGLDELTKPIFYQLFGQLIGYHQAVKKGIDPTNPRNLDYCVIF